MGKGINGRGAGKRRYGGARDVAAKEAWESPVPIGPPLPSEPLPPPPEGAIGIQPWGVLPAKPPGKRGGKGS